MYRDIDADYNGKADQYRWFHMNGTRWGLDIDEDGTIDRWKRISPEEVSAECIEALKSGDLKRFQALKLTDAELEELGLSKVKASSLTQKLETLDDTFRNVAESQNALNEQTEWLQFDGNRPGTFAAEGGRKRNRGRSLRERSRYGTNG